MKKKIAFVGIVLVGLCSLFMIFHETDLNSLSQTDYSWIDLPDEVKGAYLSSGTSDFLNLDSFKYAVTYEQTAILNAYRPVNQFRIQSKKFKLPYNYNAELPPFIFYDERLWVVLMTGGGGPLFKNEATYAQFQFRSYDLSPFVGSR